MSPSLFWSLTGCLDRIVAVGLGLGIQVLAVATGRGEPGHLLAGVGLPWRKSAVRCARGFSPGLRRDILPQVLIGRNVLGNLVISHPNSQALGEAQDKGQSGTGKAGR